MHRALRHPSRVSLIGPVCGVNAYLLRFLDSVGAQRYPRDRIRRGSGDRHRPPGFPSVAGRRSQVDVAGQPQAILFSVHECLIRKDRAVEALRAAGYVGRLVGLGGGVRAWAAR